MKSLSNNVNLIQEHMHLCCNNKKIHLLLVNYNKAKSTLN